MPILAAYAVPHPPLIIPNIDPGSEQEIQATVNAYEEVGRRIASLKPETLVISTPHSIMYRDYNHISPGAQAKGSFEQFGDPADSYEVCYDQDFVRVLCSSADKEGLPAGTEGERDPSLDHATMIPLHFIQKHWPTDIPFPRVVRIGLSGLSPAIHYRLGQLVQETAATLGRKVVYVASGDLSHKLKQSGPYGFAPEGPRFDKIIEDAFSKGNFMELLTIDQGFAERAAECGLRSFQIMAGALDCTAVRPELLSLEGPFGVGYGVACFTPTGREASDLSRNFLVQYEAWHAHKVENHRKREDLFVQLARTSLETYICTGKRLNLSRSSLIETLSSFNHSVPSRIAASIDSMFSDRAGCFVSLKKDGELRGCIGTITATRANLAEEICDNAVSAGIHDPRFPPVTQNELAELVYDVDVLMSPERISSSKELDPSRYGVIVSATDGRRGLLLPDLDGVDTIQQQISIAARKGNIDLDHDDVAFERFEVVRHT